MPVVAQWDDHEVCNNWYHELVLADDARYTEKRARVLAERARRALFEFLPIRRHPAERERVYRRFAWGPLLELFVVDLRSYRGANSPNTQAAPSAATALMGAAQLAWLQRALRAGRATWKVIASDMPVGLVVPDPPRGGERTQEGFSDGDPGAPLGREHEIAALLRFLKARAHPERRLGDGGRALRGGAPLRAGARGVHRLRPVLGVRRGPDARRHLRAQRARRHVRAGGALRAAGAAA